MMNRNGTGTLDIKTAIFPAGVARMMETAERAWMAGAPAEYLMPLARPSLTEAQAWCRRLATSHYENFHVATWFLPKRARPHFESIYAFSRAADDLGDEVASPDIATRLLGQWREMLDECYQAPEKSMHPVFVALHQTITETGVPRQLFDDLIKAFEMDQVKTRFETLEELGAYSRLSANPVGRLVLWVSGYRDEERGVLSDKVCTALQLANFWQDVVEDWQRDRRYLPGEEMRRFGVTDEDIAGRRFTPEFRAMMKSLVEYAEGMLRDGGAVAGKVDKELAVTLRLFEAGGRAALDGIVAQGYDVLKRRPSVSKTTKVRLLAGAFGREDDQYVLRRGRDRMTLEEAYEFCRDVAKREAKNFYYAFRVLPKAKSDAMCAVYAFMRRADDIADDESSSLEARRQAMKAWWGSRRDGGDPVFMALADTQARFGIKDELLEDLVRGTTMDLEPGDAAGAGGGGKSVDLGGGLQGYPTFGDLYRYCYLVASVVGLVSIRIFGYSDPAAELLAEKTGVAFQLTNILRDIKEDAERKRIYLPQDMLKEFGVTNAGRAGNGRGQAN